MLGHDLTGKRCNPRDLDKNPYSEAEQARQTKFAQVREAIKALTPEQKADYAAAFEKTQASIQPSTATSSPKNTRSLASKLF